ncbi:hypothetical protein TNIN_305821 [Trichonephila inaurata madagascariensis]|uniref:Uncharacterized protein n=1 Tax=Trichonephila inaurata madagascariensis TaxID=2747483 RepID=A0A8X7CR78_9ARAC|nr:hypothetical protein TNIN_305821 [Trichonephila inaurata madagascariensis]
MRTRHDLPVCHLKPNRNCGEQGNSLYVAAKASKDFPPTRQQEAKKYHSNKWPCDADENKKEMPLKCTDIHVML